MIVSCGWRDQLLTTVEGIMQHAQSPAVNASADGAAGIFGTATPWTTVARASGEERFLVANSMLVRYLEGWAEAILPRSLTRRPRTTSSTIHSSAATRDERCRSTSRCCDRDVRRREWRECRSGVHAHGPMRPFQRGWRQYWRKFSTLGSPESVLSWSRTAASLPRQSPTT